MVVLQDRIKSRWGIALLALALAACNSVSPGPPSIPGATPPNLAQPSAAPEQMAPPTVTSETASPVETATPLGSPTAPSQVGETATPPSTNSGPASSTPAPSGGMKTYSNSSWHIALDYPADWSARESAKIVTFTSPSGAAIQLALVSAGNIASVDFQSGLDLPNTRCTSRTNAHGIAERVCFDTISFSTSAEFILQTAGGELHLFELSTGRRTGDIPVLDAMVASVRPAP